MMKKLLVLAGLLMPNLLFGENGKTNEVEDVAVNYRLEMPEVVNGNVTKRVAKYFLKEADEKVGNAYGSSMANAGFELSQKDIQRRIILKRGEIPIGNAALSGLSEAILEGIELKGGIKDGIFGLRDEFFEWKGIRFTSIGTFSEIISRKERKDSELTYGVDLLRTDPNVYVKKDFSAPLDIGLGARASWEYGEIAVHKYLCKNWRITSGAKMYYTINEGDGRVYFAIQRDKVLGGTAVAGIEHRFPSGKRVKEYVGEEMMKKGESRVMIGWNRRF